MWKVGRDFYRVFIIFHAKREKKKEENPLQLTTYNCRSMLTHSKWIAGKGRTPWFSSLSRSSSCPLGVAQELSLKMPPIPTSWPSYICFPKHLQQSLDGGDRWPMGCCLTVRTQLRDRETRRKAFYTWEFGDHN